MTETPKTEPRVPPYLQQTPVDEALAQWLGALRQAGVLRAAATETIPTAAARGRVLGGPALAKFSSPAYHACAMDGYAVRAADTHHASETSPVRLELGTQARYVDTGDPLPDGCDAVVMIEDAGTAGPGHIELIAGAAPWQHVRPIGEDIAAGEMLLPGGWRLRGEDVAVLASAGVAEVAVKVRPVVAVVPTGDEILPLAALAGRPPEPGQIIESNSLLAAGIVEDAGGMAVVHPVVPDDPQTIKDAVARAAATADVVVVSAGSSAGSADHTSRTIADLGRVVVHGVASRPGKPVILGIAAGKPALAWPPGFRACSLDARFSGRLRREHPRSAGPATGADRPSCPPHAFAGRGSRVPVGKGRPDRRRVRSGAAVAWCGRPFVAGARRRDGGRAGGAGVAMRREKGGGGVAAPPGGDRFRRFVAIGSHDMSLDVLADMFRSIHPGTSLGSANVGSLGGLQALGRGEAHLAGTPPARRGQRRL